MRKQFIAWLFEKTSIIYTTYFKKQKPWSITKQELLEFNEGSLGKGLGEFLKSNGFNLLPKVERHDAYHVITGISTKVEDEIALQCLLFGNGKRSIYLLGSIILGLTLLPEHMKYYYKCYYIGRCANTFYNYDFQQLLQVSLTEFRVVIFSKNRLTQLNIT